VHGDVGGCDVLLRGRSGRHSISIQFYVRGHDRFANGSRVWTQAGARRPSARLAEERKIKINIVTLQTVRANQELVTAQGSVHSL
jgi:hypothetical protein